MFSAGEHKCVEKQEEDGLCSCQRVVAIVSGTSTCTSQHSPEPVQPVWEEIVPLPLSACSQICLVGMGYGGTAQGRGWQRDCARVPAPVPSDVSCVNAAVAGSGRRSCRHGERQLEGSREPAGLR